MSLPKLKQSRVQLLKFDCPPHLLQYQVGCSAVGNFKSHTNLLWLTDYFS